MLRQIQGEMKNDYFGFRAPADIAVELRETARKQKRTVSAVLVLILRDWFAKPDKLTRKGQ